MAIGKEQENTAVEKPKDAVDKKEEKNVKDKEPELVCDFDLSGYLL